MPTYEYQCFACNHRFEVFQKISEDPIRVCPVCNANSSSVKRLLSAAPFHLKGSGWYKTDYGKSSSPSGAAGPASKGEHKDEAAAKCAEGAKKEVSGESASDTKMGGTSSGSSSAGSSSMGSSSTGSGSSGGSGE